MPSFWVKKSCAAIPWRATADRKAPHCELYDPDERRVEDGSILALQQAQRSNFVGQRDGDVLTYFFAQDGGSAALMLGVDR